MCNWSGDCESVHGVWRRCLGRHLTANKSSSKEIKEVMNGISVDFHTPALVLSIEYTLTCCIEPCLSEQVNVCV